MNEIKIEYTCVDCGDKESERILCDICSKRLCHKCVVNTIKEGRICNSCYEKYVVGRCW